MRIAYLECFSGISGDMFLGALLDAGVPFELFQTTVAGLKIGAELEHARVDRAGVSATKVDVVINGQRDMPREEFWRQHHTGSQEHEPPNTHEPNRSQKHGRNLSEILRIIGSAPISEYARRTANEIFLALGAAEATVHNVSMEQVHFHEIGAEDAIVDIVCGAVGAEALEVDQFLASPLNVGSGMIACAHGILPVPAPATLELLKQIPIYSGDIQKELVTPTGAAIVKVLVSIFGPRPLMTTERIGCGAGARSFAGHPNVLRVTVGETQQAVLGQGARNEDDAAEEEIAILETNLDDLNPQLIGYIVDQAFAEGALDVFTAPVQMKKNRPGTVLTVLARPEHEAQLRALLFRESSTLGVRTRREKRYALSRRHQVVATPWGEVRMKIAHLNGAVSQYAPEYEDCRRIAVERHVPLKTVMQEAIRLYLDQKHG